MDNLYFVFELHCGQMWENGI